MKRGELCATLERCVDRRCDGCPLSDNEECIQILLNDALEVIVADNKFIVRVMSRRREAAQDARE